MYDFNVTIKEIWPAGLMCLHLYITGIGNHLVQRSYGRQSLNVYQSKIALMKNT